MTQIRSQAQPISVLRLPDTTAELPEATDPFVVTDGLDVAAKAPVRPLTQVAVPPQTLVNHGKNVSFTPKYAFAPNGNIDELVQIMRWVQRQPAPLKVKAGGSLHSWSPAAAAQDGVFILPQQMKFLRRGADCVRNNAPDKDALFRFGAGTTLKEINKYLWANGKALPVMGGFDGQTIAGVFPTGTHGSVLSYGGMNDLVRSMDLVTPTGEKVRLEPAHGITDPVELKLRHPDFRLIQDDEAFAAALVSMGTLGVVHSVTIAAVDHFYLREKKTLTTGTAAAAVLRGENIYNLADNTTRAPAPTDRTFAGHPRPAYHLELWWNPHTDTMVTLSREKLSAEEQARLEAHEPKEFTAPPRNLPRLLRARPEYSRPKLPQITTEFFGRPLTALDALVEHDFGKLFPKFLDLSLEQTADPEYVNRSYNVFHLGDGESKLPAQAMTLSVPLQGDQYLAAMDVLRRVAKTYAEQYGIYQTAPISMRFVHASQALLGEPHDACKFEIIFSGDDARAQADAHRLMTAYYRALRQALGAQVRIHWGQTPPSDFSASDVGATFPKLNRFLAVQKQFDPQGRMLNSWQERVFKGV